MRTVGCILFLFSFCDAEARSHIPAALAAKPPLPDDNGTGPSIEAKLRAARIKEGTKETKLLKDGDVLPPD